jgi:hypothetical protein
MFLICERTIGGHINVVGSSGNRSTANEIAAMRQSSAPAGAIVWAAPASVLRDRIEEFEVA